MSFLKKSISGFFEQHKRFSKLKHFQRNMKRNLTNLFKITLTFATWFYLYFFFMPSKSLLFLFLLFFSVSIFAQSGNSPYSRVGLGDLADRASIYNLGMGGLGISNFNVAYINLKNPALIAHNTLTTFEAAYYFEAKRLETQNATQNNQGGNLANLSFLFPLRKDWTMGVGLVPYSTVNYQNISEEKLSLSPSFVQYTYKGTGGVTQVYMSHGVRILKKINVGVQLNYNFGAIRYESQSQIVDNRNLYVVELLNRLNFSDLSIRTGLSLRQKIKGNVFVNVGFVSDLAKNMNVQEYLAGQRKVNDAVISADTIPNQALSYYIPPSYEFGISIDRPFNFTVGLDYKIQDWSKYKGKSPVGALGNSHKWTLGAEWIPNANAVTGYLNRVSYRIGFSYSLTPIIINGVQLEERQASFGMSLPVRGFSSFNFAAIGGQRGVIDKGLIRETYFKLIFGVTINDRWFEKRKIY